MYSDLNISLVLLKSCTTCGRSKCFTTRPLHFSRIVGVVMDASCLFYRSYFSSSLSEGLISQAVVFCIASAARPFFSDGRWRGGVGGGDGGWLGDGGGEGSTDTPIGQTES